MMLVLHKKKQYDDPDLDIQIEELLRNIAPLQGSGTPTGVVTPRFLGDVYHDVDSNDVYVANGLTDTSWRGIGELGPPPPMDGKYYVLRNRQWEELIIT